MHSWVKYLLSIKESVHTFLGQIFIRLQNQIDASSAIFQTWNTSFWHTSNGTSEI
jgi:hypothetical protein